MYTARLAVDEPPDEHRHDDQRPQPSHEQGQQDVSHQYRDAQERSPVEEGTCCGHQAEQHSPPPEENKEDQGVAPQGHELGPPVVILAVRIPENPPGISGLALSGEHTRQPAVEHANHLLT